MLEARTQLARVSVKSAPSLAVPAELKHRASSLFLLPSLGRLAASTRSETRNPSARESTHHPAQSAGCHHSHHLSHLGVLVNHLVHVLHSGTAAACDSFSSRRVKQCMVPPFRRRH